MTSTHILIVASEPDPEVEDEYNRWYNDVHLPMFFRYEGLKKASRYKLAGGPPDSSRYIAVYEFESAEALAGFTLSDGYHEAVKDFDRKWKNGGFNHGSGGGSYELITFLER